MFMGVGMGRGERNVAMGTEAAIAPTLTVKVFFTNLQFIILPFPLFSPSSVLLYHPSAIP
jgi:hypothetical protein